MGLKICLVQPLYFIMCKLRPERSAGLPKITLLDRGRAGSSNWVSRLSIHCFYHDVLCTFEKSVYCKCINSFPSSFFFLIIWFIGGKSVNNRSVIDTDISFSVVSLWKPAVVMITAFCNTAFNLKCRLCLQVKVYRVTLFRIEIL